MDAGRFVGIGASLSSISMIRSTGSMSVHIILGVTNDSGIRVITILADLQLVFQALLGCDCWLLPLCLFLCVVHS